MYRILIFGTGNTSHKVLKILDLSKVKVLGFIDNDISKAGMKYYGLEVILPDEINKYSYDFILITSMYYVDIYKQLIDLNINKEKIINGLFVLEPSYFKINRKELQGSMCEFIITGLSYAKGIKETLLRKNGVNFAMNSQDLFFDYCIVKYILDNKEQFPNLKYCLIGLSYYSFQYDMLKTSAKGLLYRYEFLNETINKVSYTKATNISIIKKQYGFDTLYFHENFFEDIFISDMRNQAETLKDISIDIKEASKSVAILNSNKEYPQTVLENELILKDYLTLLAKNDIKPIIIINPQNQIYRRYFSSRLKLEFEQIISRLKEEFDFQYLDYYDSKYFKYKDFIDGHHLNFEGNKKLTLMLDNQINW